MAAPVYIALVRHGQYAQPAGVPSAWLPHALTQDGKRQAVRLADELVQLEDSLDAQLDDTLHTSQMLRAWSTAHIAAERLTELRQRRFAVQQHAALAERSVGGLANLTTQQIEQVIGNDPRCSELPVNWKRDPEYRLPTQGAESLMEAGERAKRCILEVLNTTAQNEPSRGRICVLVGHGGAFRHAAHLLGVIPRTQLHELSMHHARSIVLQPTPTRWRHVAGEWKARA